MADGILGCQCNQVRSHFRKIDKATVSEPLARSDFLCRKIFPVAKNKNSAQAFWLTEFSGLVAVLKLTLFLFCQFCSLSMLLAPVELML